MPTIPTSSPHVALRTLGEADVQVLHQLVQSNAEHLTQNGNYVDLIALDVDGLRGFLAKPDISDYYFGIFESNSLVGVVSLVPVDPPRFGCGYWLAETATGRGLVTIAMQGLLVYARDELEATDVFAGVTHGNGSSIAVLERLGFNESERFETYTRYRLQLRTPRVVA